MIIGIIIAALGTLLGQFLVWLLGLNARGEKPSPQQAAKIAKLFGQMAKCQRAGQTMGIAPDEGE